MPQYLTLRVLRSGRVIFREGAAGEEFFIILKGLVSVTSEHNGNLVQVATLQQGDFFGELALIEAGALRRATCICKEECHLAVLHKDVFAKCAADPLEDYQHVPWRGGEDHHPLAAQ